MAQQEKKWRDMRRGILVVFPHRNLPSHPSMVEIVRVLTEKWAFVHFMSPRGDARIRKGQDPAAVDFLMERGSPNPYRGMGRLRRLRRRYALSAFARDKRKYAAVIGVDPEGLIHAHELNKYLRCPLVYVSFEILFRNEADGEREVALKAAETRASREVALVLVQDELREHLLRENNEFQAPAFCHCPVSPAPQPIRRSTVLRDVLRIPDDRRIVLFAGSLATFNSRDLLPEMVARWKDPYHLVIHSRFDPTKREKLFLQELAASTGRVSFTGSSVRPEALTDVFSSADFALLPYLPDPTSWLTYQNVYHIGMASGKAAYAAMCGLPLITSALPTYKKLFAQFQCGGVYSNLDEIPGLLTRLDSNYRFHSSEARRCYGELMDPSKGMDSFCCELERISESSTSQPKMRAPNDGLVA